MCDREGVVCEGGLDGCGAVVDFAVASQYHPAMRWLADCCYVLAGLLYLPLLLYQMLIQGKNRRGWLQRMGWIPSRQGERAAVWIHAVSLGEVNATRLLIGQLSSACPDVEIVLSTTTDTGFARARQLYPHMTVFRYPLDFSWVVGRVLRRLRPAMIVLVELEVWYNLVTLASRRNIPVCVVNGRFSARSARRMRWLGRLARPMFAGLTWVGAQSRDIADRFQAAGVPAERLEVLGSVKWDTAGVCRKVDGADALARAVGLRRDRPFIVVGSSGPGEEAVVLDAWEQLLNSVEHVQLAIIPRKPERFREVARLIERRGCVCVRRSEFSDDALPPTNTTGRCVILGDTMGELRKFYSLCDVAVIGRTLVPLGGSDPMEIAALGKPAVCGVHFANFAEAVDVLSREEALRVVESSADLARGLTELLRDVPRCRRMGDQARRVVLAQQGATAATVRRLVEALRPSSGT